MFRIAGLAGARFQGVPFGTYYVRVRGVQNGILAMVEGRRVTLGWSGVAESEPAADDLVEIGSSVDASNVLATIVFSGPGYPGAFATELAPGRYFARVRRLDRRCGGRSNPSPEVTFEILPQ